MRYLNETEIKWRFGNLLILHTNHQRVDLNDVEIYKYKCGVCKHPLVTTEEVNFKRLVGTCPHCTVGIDNDDFNHYGYQVFYRSEHQRISERLKRIDKSSEVEYLFNMMRNCWQIRWSYSDYRIYMDHHDKIKGPYRHAFIRCVNWAVHD